ncbi:ATP-binding cassette domain-containing protein [Streptosporangium sp. NPDC000396]|uniref:ABC transporter ATP-binding protein n=1 Tax=Streptosporangium sp. NPDC000396 TaxID=3366185 RepID=UPI0036D15FF0
MFHGVAVHAVGLSLKGAHGWVYRDVGVDAGPGSLTAVTGQAGSGRTSLLLTLAGRMKPTEGTLTVAGRSKPRAIGRVAALGLVDGVNDLEKALSVREHLHERARGFFWGKRQAAQAQNALVLAGLDMSSDDRALIRDLSREQQVRLGIALALLDEPGLLVLDNVDIGLAQDRQDELWATLEDLAGRGLTIIASCTESELATAVRLSSAEPVVEPAEAAEPVGLMELMEPVGSAELAEPAEPAEQVDEVEEAVVSQAVPDPAETAPAETAPEETDPAKTALEETPQAVPDESETEGSAGPRREEPETHAVLAEGKDR